jgi:hypothetical protein
MTMATERHGRNKENEWVFIFEVLLVLWGEET